MSYVSSGKKSSTPSILKRLDKPKTPVRRSVCFNFTSDLKSLLRDYRNSNQKDPYVQLICNIRDSGVDIKDEELTQLVKDAQDCLPLLDEHLKLFVQVILMQKWADRSDTVVTTFQNFILDICTAYSTHTKFALKQLVLAFLEVKEDSMFGNCLPSDDEERMFHNVHFVLEALLKLIPMAGSALLEIIKEKFPFKKESSRRHLNYVHNILIVTTYAPDLRCEILSLIINKLIHIDVILSTNDLHAVGFNSNKMAVDQENVFEIDIDEEIIQIEDMINVDARTLDYCLHRIYEYLYSECHDSQGVLCWNKTKTLYHDLITIFDHLLLPTHASSHVQFIYFYFCSFKLTLMEAFVNNLFAKIRKPSVPAVLRQTALCYLSGIVSRANYVPVSVLKSVIIDLTEWIHQYIDKSGDVKADCKIDPTKVHGAFYSACHALFYIIAFRHGELVNNKRNLKFLENLNLGKIVTCRYNPLDFCSSAVAHSFANIMQSYQLTYCYSVMNIGDMSMDNNLMDDFFPFDFYSLKRSSAKIKEMFREYETPLDLSNDSSSCDIEKDSDDEDDFIPSGISPHLPIIMEGSPGFCVFK